VDGKDMSKLSSEIIEKLKNRCIEDIVSAIIEIEELNCLSTYNLSFSDTCAILQKPMKIGSARIVISKDKITITWLSNTLILNRAQSEEEYFQLMCLDCEYCDREIEEGIKELFDLYLSWRYKQLAIGGFIEGAYATDDKNC
jgi:hypothetical protein